MQVVTLQRLQEIPAVDRPRYEQTSRPLAATVRIAVCGSQATEPIRANDADLREVAAGLAGGLARVVVGFFNSVVDGGSFDAHVFTVESLEDFRCRDGRMNFFRIAVALLVPAVFLAGHAVARDDGRYANSPLKPWFDSLKSGKGPCCSDADGSVVADVDWESKDGHYRVRLWGQWIDVPDDAVITEPNRAGRTMVWPMWGTVGISIRCFLPGSMT
jgi:hypothetical protein